MMAASLALILGTLAGFAMARFARFPGRTLFGFALLAPLVVPEVILGLSLLLLFVACEHRSAGRTAAASLTITIAHATFGASLCRGAGARPARGVRPHPRRGGARSRRAAVGGAGADHPAGDRPALVSGWLLAFTLSLDDLVVASFVTGPSATTLPMAVFSSVRLGVSPEINALATLFLAVVFVLVALAFWLMARQERRRS